MVATTAGLAVVAPAGTLAAVAVDVLRAERATVGITATPLESEATDWREERSAPAILVDEAAVTAEPRLPPARGGAEGEADIFAE